MPAHVILSAERIRLDANPGSKDEAIRQAAQLLVDTGAIAPAYVESMLRREGEAETYLGDGIAIPHGQRNDRNLIHSTAISVLQVPKGVDWGEDKARLVVAIAAQGDEHIEVLRRLTEVLGDSALAERLATTRDPGLILRTLDPDAAPAATAPAMPPAGSLEASGEGFSIGVQAPGAAGLHARPARALAGIAKRYDAAIEIRHGDRRADAKSMISLLQLGAGANAQLTVTARGPQAAEALEAVRAGFVAGLGEGDDDHAPADRAPEAMAPVAEEGAIAGLPASPGVAIGVIFRHRSESAGYAETAADPAAERAALDGALVEAKAELRQVAADMTTRIGAKHAAIFGAHEEFLDDPELLAEARMRIEKGASAPAAWDGATASRAEALVALGDPLLAERANDLKDVSRRVLRRLTGASGDPDISVPLPERAVVVAEDLTPSETAGLDPMRVVGLVTAAGGPTAHTAILARALGIPAIVAAGPSVMALPDGTPVIVDGDRGLLRPDPDAAQLAAAEKAIASGRDRAAAAKAAAFRPAVTRDGHRVEVAANCRKPEEAVEAVAAGAEGTGLVRSEFLFDDRAEPPTEDEQFEIYRKLAEGFGGLPVVLRTLDAGGDKPLRFVRHPAEANPFLGLRGLRLCLANPELFRPQIRAALRAARHGDIRIMLPMVDGLADLRAAKALIEEERRALVAPPVEVGIMVEVPAAAVMADQLAAEADFFSIGTNDLTQYTLAVDRLHPTLGARSDALDPAVLRLIDMTVKAAHARGRWVGVCGNMAADPVAAAILVGLGVDELSVSIPNVAALKAQIRGLSRNEAERLARTALNCATAAEVRALPVAREMAHAA